MNTLPDRLVIARLPGSAWALILTTHIAGVRRLGPEAFLERERAGVGRQLLVLYEAALVGCPPTFDNSMTELREAVEETCRAFGFDPSEPEHAFAADQVMTADGGSGI